MKQAITKGMQIGLGLAHMGKEKAEELATELKKGKGEHIEAGKKFAKEIDEQRQKQQQKIELFVEKRVQEILHKTGMATKKDLDELQKRIQSLESKKR